MKLLSGNGLLIAGNVKDLTARCACATPNTQRQFHRGLPNVASRGITAHGSPSLPGLPGSGPALGLARLVWLPHPVQKKGRGRVEKTWNIGAPTPMDLLPFDGSLTLW